MLGSYAARSHSHSFPRQWNICFLTHATFHIISLFCLHLRWDKSAGIQELFSFLRIGTKQFVRSTIWILPGSIMMPFELWSKITHNCVQNP